MAQDIRRVSVVFGTSGALWPAAAAQVACSSRRRVAILGAGVAPFSTGNAPAPGGRACRVNRLGGIGRRIDSPSTSFLDFADAFDLPSLPEPRATPRRTGRASRDRHQRGVRAPHRSDRHRQGAGRERDGGRLRVLRRRGPDRAHQSRRGGVGKLHGRAAGRGRGRAIARDRPEHLSLSRRAAGHAVDGHRRRPAAWP